MKKRIEELYCYAIIDEDGNEGVPAITLQGQVFPLMGADMDRMQSMASAARLMEKSRGDGKKIRLYKFTNKEELKF